MAECKELMESRMLQEVASCASDDENLPDKLAEMVLPTVRSLAERSNPDNSHPTQILLGKGNAAFSDCSFNITNIYRGDNDALQKSSVTEVESSCPLPSKSVHESEELHSQATGEMSSTLPSPKWTKSNQEMILRVIPLATEMEEDCDDDYLILVVWICWDDDRTFQKIVTSEHESGNVTLDSYDTIILRKPVQGRWNDVITIRVSTNEEYSWEPSQYLKRIQSSQVWNAQRAKCSFRMRKNSEYPESRLMYITLLINLNGEPTDTQFILRKRISDIRMPKEGKRELLQLLNSKISVRRTTQSNCTQCNDNDDSQDFHENKSEKSSFTCWAIPYVDKLLSFDDDVIVTLWLCWFDERGTLLEALKREQKLYSRKVLDTENSFVLSNSEEYIETEIKHNGYSTEFYLDHQKVILEAQRIVQGMRAKFQFISKRMESGGEYADRIAGREGNNNIFKMEKRLLSGHNRKKHEARNLLPKVKPNKLDIEIITKQGEQEPIEFRKVTEISRFVCGGIKRASERRVSSRLKSHIKSAFRNLKYRGSRHAVGQGWTAEGMNRIIYQAQAQCGFSDTELEAQGPASPGVRYAASAQGFPVQQSGTVEADIFIQDPQQHVLRLYIFASQEHDCNNALNLHVVLVTVSPPDAHHQWTQDEEHEWAAVDSYDTFLLTSQVCGCYDPLVKVTFQAHQTSHWVPDSDKMVIDVKEILKEGIVKCSCRFSATSDSQNNIFYGTMKISQKVGRSKEEVQFVVKKKMEDIERLIKENSSSTFEHLIVPPVWSSDNADEGVMLDEYQTCLAVSYVDLMQNINDDIILTVWICSIQQSKNNFSILCEDQDRFMKKQLDTENSFVFSDMISPVYAEVNGFWIRGYSEQKVDPRRIRDGGRAKFQFVCGRRTSLEKCKKLNVEITISQNFWNRVQFMTRRKEEFFLQDEFPTKHQDTGNTEINYTA